MRDKRFVAAHRGGPLTKEEHRALMLWAIACAGRVLPLYKGTGKNVLEEVLGTAKAWADGMATTGEAMKASLKAHAVARADADAVSVSVARAIGQGVATAHMADHSMGAALYALQAVNRAGKSAEKEKAWQHEKLKKLPAHIVQLITESMAQKAQSFKI